MASHLAGLSQPDRALLFRELWAQLQDLEDDLERARLLVLSEAAWHGVTNAELARSIDTTRQAFQRKWKPRIQRVLIAADART